MHCWSGLGGKGPWPSNLQDVSRAWSGGGQWARAGRRPRFGVLKIADGTGNYLTSTTTRSRCSAADLGRHAPGRPHRQGPCPRAAAREAAGRGARGRAAALRPAGHQKVVCFQSKSLPMSTSSTLYLLRMACGQRAAGGAQAAQRAWPTTSPTEAAPLPWQAAPAGKPDKAKSKAMARRGVGKGGLGGGRTSSAERSAASMPTAACTSCLSACLRILFSRLRSSFSSSCAVGQRGGGLGGRRLGCCAPAGPAEGAGPWQAVGGRRRRTRAALVCRPYGSRSTAAGERDEVGAARALGRTAAVRPMQGAEWPARASRTSSAASLSS